MRLWVKPDQLAKLSITVLEIVTALQSQNTVNPAGQIGGERRGAGIHIPFRAQGRSRP
jgi:HAE1 family hydrophobic/amphiphilic exporter-1